MLLLLLSLPLALKAVLALWSGELPAFAGAGSAFVLLVAAALLYREAGAREQPAKGARPQRRRGRWLPLKIMASGLAGLGTAVAALIAAGHGPAIALIFGLLAGLGCLLLYGMDVRPQTGDRLPGEPDEEELTRSLAEAQQRLERLAAAGRQMASIEFRQRLDTITTAVSDILTLVEQDPRDLRRTRKFLNVYLDGAARITEQYARAHPSARSPELEHSFRTLLVDIENTCVEQHQKLLQHDVMDLDIQIEVLSARLRQEGVN